MQYERFSAVSDKQLERRLQMFEARAAECTAELKRREEERRKLEAETEYCRTIARRVIEQARSGDGFTRLTEQLLNVIAVNILIERGKARGESK